MESKVCYKCQQPGHFASQCPTRAAGIYGATAGRGAVGGVQPPAAGRGGGRGFTKVSAGVPAVHGDQPVICPYCSRQARYIVKEYPPETGKAPFEYYKCPDCKDPEFFKPKAWYDPNQPLPYGVQPPTFDGKQQPAGTKRPRAEEEEDKHGTWESTNDVRVGLQQAASSTPFGTAFPPQSAIAITRLELKLETDRVIAAFEALRKDVRVSLNEMVAAFKQAVQQPEEKPRDENEPPFTQSE